MIINTIKRAMCEKVLKFEELRGTQSTKPSWDLVVLSVMDVEQQNAFEIQIEEKLDAGELPLSSKYHVFHDPVGVKVGNGGGVLAVIDELDRIYGEKLSTFKVLILLSGGYSQRLPSASALGKVFSALPFGDPVYQMLEAKLTMLIELPERMIPGVFVASSDAFELFELSDDDWTFTRPGVTALAHISPIETGLTHGVFVPEKNYQNLNASNSSQMAKCLRFLHKPSKEAMRSCGATFKHKGEECIYSDSAYFMDTCTVYLLLNWFRMHGPLTCEIDAYGDFLQALGIQSTVDYCRNTRNVTKVHQDLVETREKIYHVLEDVSFNALLLGVSKFYHIGTTKEYLYHFCQDDVFRTELCLKNYAMIKTNSCLQKIEHRRNIVIHSYIPDLSCIKENVIIEYSSLKASNTISENCIISNCVFGEDIHVLPNTFLHTIPIVGSGCTYYVTFGFGVDDNLKKEVDQRCKTGDLIFCGKPLSEILKVLNLTEVFDENVSHVNLWNARLFGGFTSPEQSLEFAVQMTLCLTNGFHAPQMEGVRLYSIAEVLRLKDLKHMMNMRRILRLQIHS